MVSECAIKFFINLPGQSNLRQQSLLNEAPSHNFFEQHLLNWADKDIHSWHSTLDANVDLCYMWFKTVLLIFLKSDKYYVKDRWLNAWCSEFLEKILVPRHSSIQHSAVGRSTTRHTYTKPLFHLDSAQPNGARCSDDLAAAHYRLTHTVLMGTACIIR